MCNTRARTKIKKQPQPHNLKRVDKWLSNFELKLLMTCADMMSPKPERRRSRQVQKRLGGDTGPV